jgi:BlaI family transcriptional regulator, penicillinase repressor
MKQRREFGELETLVIEEVRKKKRASVNDVHGFFEQKIAYTTIMTVMNRLFEKKVFLREKIGRNFIYWLKEDSSFLSSFLERVREKFFKGREVDLVSYLLENKDISREELEKIDRLIQKAKEKKSCK